MRKVCVTRLDPKTGRIAGRIFDVEDGISNEDIRSQHLKDGVELVISDVSSNTSEGYHPDPWGEYDEELHGYVNSETHEFSPGHIRPTRELPPRSNTGRFIH